MIRIFRHYVPRSLVILGTVEALILLGSVYLGVTLRLLDFNPTGKLLVGSTWTKAIAYAAAMLLMLSVVGLYQRGLRVDVRGMLLRLGVAFAVGIALAVPFNLFVPQLSVGTLAFGIAVTMSVVGVATFRLLVYRYADSDIFKRRVLVLGAGEVASQIEQLRRRSDWRDAILLGYVHARDEVVRVPEYKVMESEDTLLDVALHHKADHIVVALDEGGPGFPINEILDCKMNGIAILDLVQFFEQQTGRIQVDALTPSSIVFAEGFIQAVLRSWGHRGFDIVVSSLFLLVAWPIMLGAALCIWAESGGREPILYRQRRVGRNGREFEILKFRSMRTDAEAAGKAQWAQADDARITKVGGFIRKTRIDELPQLVNVLRGDMSFVGPRPERPEFVADLARKIPFYDLRHRVNPGITGWAQICYPYGASDEDAKHKLQYDLYYIKNSSFFLDMMILLQTAQVILWGKGAR